MIKGGRPTSRGHGGGLNRGGSREGGASYQSGGGVSGGYEKSTTPGRQTDGNPNLIRIDGRKPDPRSQDDIDGKKCDHYQKRNHSSRNCMTRRSHKRKLINKDETAHSDILDKEDYRRYMNSLKQREKKTVASIFEKKMAPMSEPNAAPQQPQQQAPAFHFYQSMPMGMQSQVPQYQQAMPPQSAVAPPPVAPAQAETAAGGAAKTATTSSANPTSQTTTESGSKAGF